jgi:hypothetical protein
MGEKNLKASYAVEVRSLIDGRNFLYVRAEAF